jgi:hypothetical protein
LSLPNAGRAGEWRIVELIAAPGAASAQHLRLTDVPHLMDAMVGLPVSKMFLIQSGRNQLPRSLRMLTTR